MTRDCKENESEGGKREREGEKNRERAVEGREEIIASI